MQDLLNQFVKSLHKENHKKTYSFGKKLEQDITQTSEAFLKDGTKFIIEPFQVNYSQIVRGHYIIHQFTGSFIYGFEKNGVFHEVPGDLSTQKHRSPNQNGTISFLQKADDKAILGVRETFAGNTFGEYPLKESNSKRWPVWKIVCTVFLVFLIVSSIYSQVKNRLVGSDYTPPEATEQMASLSFLEVDQEMVFPWGWMTFYSVERDDLDVDEYEFSLRSSSDIYKNFDLRVLSEGDVYSQWEACNSGDVMCSRLVSPDVFTQDADVFLSEIPYVVQEGEVNGDNAFYRVYITFLSDHMIEFFFTSLSGDDWGLAENTLADISLRQECHGCSRITWH